MKERLTKNELRALRYIRNALVHNVKNPSVRGLMHEMGYASPNSANFLIQKLIGKGLLRRKEDGQLQLVSDVTSSFANIETINIPLVGSVACGVPMLAVENIKAYVPVSIKMARPPYKYFLLRAKGDSMNEKGINDGDLILVRQQEVAENGDIVVALIDDEATVKQIYISPDAIILKPRSKNKKHQPIILDRDIVIQGVVVSSIPDPSKLGHKKDH